ncbi:Increased rDNA silencing 4 [Lecanosticta acicola]|uniref:Increased rDNA silencing 4 n=1 Tax=Lecanosticta acicola TaxID=111012 RepID=A0AAI9E894_9PEZI|nr:Increased rDNA silencing 4 [Lecanosticta acicola]
MPGPTAPSRPSRASSIASVDTTTTSQSGNANANANTNAALLGATLALRRSAPAPAPWTPTSPLPPNTNTNTNTKSNTSAASNGALAAASSVGTAGKSVSPSNTTRSVRPPLRRPGSSVAGSDSMRQTKPMDYSHASSRAAPQPQRPPHGRFPSQQAAMLATSRAVPPPAEPANSTHERSRPGRLRAGSPTTTRPPIAPKPRRLSEHRKTSAVDSSDTPTDITSIAPTTSLVDLFEQRSRTTKAQGKRPQPIVIKPSDDLAIKSPKPVRSGITSMLHLELGEKTKDRPRPQPEISTVEPVKVSPRGNQGYDGNSSDDSFASASEDLNARSPPASPVAAAAARRTSDAASPSSGPTLKVQHDAKRRPAVSPSSVPQHASKPIDIQPSKRTGTAPSDAVSASPASQTLRTIPAQFNQAYPRRMTPLTTGDDLANALVASSLASSRGPSPAKSDAPPVPTRRKHHNHHHHRRLSFSSRPSSPAKTGMMRTLRKQEESSGSSDEENEQHPYGHHRKKRLVRKHPNKHHEGDRKRWRDAVTERERKRYEGVWASNKGLHCCLTLAEQERVRTAPNEPRTKDLQAVLNDQVSNIVVRDIWNRSRLSESVLETVWDLVDHNAVGRLGKEAFIVGMWLIDQRLKGRKLPVRVTESVWTSVRGIHGIKIRK